MTKKIGSFVYVVGRECNLVSRAHKRTLNEAKEYGLRYIHDKDEVFYRFTKIPFPYLFYVSDSYIVFVNYVTVDSKKVPYSVRLTDKDINVKKAMELFEEKTNKQFYYDRDSRAKYRDITKRTQRRNVNKQKGLKNKQKHYNTYSDWVGVFFVLKEGEINE